MNDRVAYGFGSMVLLFGAFVVGSVIHQVFVEGTFSLTSPVAVFGTIIGIVLIGIGRRVENRHKEARYPDESEDEEDTFDEEEAPFDESDLEKYERDDRD
jgi:hypothetical protein